MFRQGQLAVHGLAILLGRNEAGISNRGKFFLHHAVAGVEVRSNTIVPPAAARETIKNLGRVSDSPAPPPVYLSERDAGIKPDRYLCQTVSGYLEWHRNIFDPPIDGH